MQAQIYPISPIDPSVGSTIRFAWTGNQAFKNRCIIKQNDTNETVYDAVIDTFRLEHEIDFSKAALEHGKKYKAYIIVFDKDNNASDMPALGEVFYCLTTPIFRFANLTGGQVIPASSYEFQLEYSQEDGEPLDSWSISLYNPSYSLIASSSVRYDTKDLSYIFDGFNNKSEYFVRAAGATVNGISLDTGYIPISVTFNMQDVFSLLELTNRPRIGAIQIRSNISSSEGHLEKDAVYIDNESLDLTDNSIKYTEGFLLRSDFSLVFIGYGFLVNHWIPLLKGKEHAGRLCFRIGKIETDTLQAYFEWNVLSNGVSYTIHSNRIPLPEARDPIEVCLVRQDHLYDIKIKNLTKEV